jgi:hypothetical protein
MGMAAVHVVSDLVAVLLTSVVSCAPPGTPSSVSHGCCSGTGRIWCLPPIPISSLQDIAVVGVNPTTHPTPLTFCLSCEGAGSVVSPGMDISLPKRPSLEAHVISGMMV